MDFTPSQPLTVGMELELQLVDADTLDLVDGIIPLMQFYPDSKFVKPEFIQNTVEVASKVCRTLPELHDHIRVLVTELRHKCNELGMRLCGAGSHAFSQRLALITPLPRYLKLEKAAGYLGYSQVTFATHVHVGLASGDQAISVMRRLKPYLPLLIALSANSPFWRGYDTGYVSYRHRILAATRSYGIPPSFESWGAFSSFLNMAQCAGIFETINDIHWDIRPRPHLGTVEIRTMDAQSTVEQAVSLAGFVRALVILLIRTEQKKNNNKLPRPLPWWIEKENHFQASRLGLRANYIRDEQGTVVPLAVMLERVFESVRPIAREFDEADYLALLEDSIAKDTRYRHQRKVYQQTGMLAKVTASLVELLATEQHRPKYRLSSGASAQG